MSVTRKLKKALSLLQISLVDHVICTSSSISLRETHPVLFI
ncbi:MAG: hypothetical protein CSA81_03700 [Acidobacteria bacterium]|nr:MAG: hypothetical protein CSA81_03700 [Acidobacteriota bacterium]